VQACPDEDVIDHARLALESPEGAAIDAVHRDRVKLAPAFEATVGLENSLKQIAHFSSLSCFVVASSRKVSSVWSSSCIQKRSDVIGDLLPGLHNTILNIFEHISV
jgi:hypothetical protein